MTPAGAKTAAGVRPDDRFRNLFDHLPEALLVLRLDGRIVEANGAAAALYGYELDALPGRHVTEITVDMDERLLMEQQPYLREHGSLVAEATGVRRDGSRFPQRVTVTPVEDRGEELMFVLSRDLSEQRRLERSAARLEGELLQAQKMESLGQLITGVAHELNNPLSAIIAFSQLMRRDDRLPADVHRDAELVMREADRTRRIVQNLLDFARQRPPERRPASIRELIERTLELHAYALGMARISVEQRYPAYLPPVDVDAGQIQQVLLNLTVNAIQAIRSVRTSGSLAIEVTLMQAPDGASGTGTLRVSLTDDGPGVPEPIRSRLFEPFFTTKDVGQGTGLGLSVSEGIVESHGGRLWYEPAPDGGSRFAFELPAHWAVGRSSGPPTAEPQRG